MKLRRLIVATFAVLLAMGFTGSSALANGGDGGQKKCNSGNGNGSESTVESDCDPGNSGDNNNGGD